MAAITAAISSPSAWLVPVQEADDFFGSTVNYAARVASQALGGEVLVSSIVRELVVGAGAGIAFLESRDVELKGLDGSHRIYAVDLAALSVAAQLDRQANQLSRGSDERILSPTHPQCVGKSQEVE